MDPHSALETIVAACERGQLDRTRIVRALDVLASAPDADDVDEAVLKLGEAMLDGRFGDRRHADVLEQCVTLLARAPNRRALAFYRAATAVHLPTPRGDQACVLRARALMALRDLEPHEARFVAARLVTDEERSLSGEPAISALAVLGAASDDVALIMACRTALVGELPLMIAALQELSPDVPAATFWEIATPLVGDRFSDAVLAITDIIVEAKRSDLVPGFGAALADVSDPDLMRAVLLSFATAHLNGLEDAFAAVVERAPRRALDGVGDALDLARIPAQQALQSRLQQRLRDSRS
jgi:hypothetical protein